jgi:hypothetical protein
VETRRNIWHAPTATIYAKLALTSTEIHRATRNQTLGLARLHFV